MSLASAACPCRAHSFAAFATAVAGTLAAVVMVLGCAPSPALPPAPIAVPAALAAPATQSLALELHARGVQVYECAPAGVGSEQHAWRLQGPDAQLRDGATRSVGVHYAGPTWESFDGSAVVARPVARVESAQTGAVPWLLLEAVSNRGDGAFARVRSIQRLETSGGQPPAGGCDRAQAGRVARVPYRAVYRFYADSAPQRHAAMLMPH